MTVFQKYIVELYESHSCGVMRNFNLSKTALITAAQILQDICRQVLQNFNLFLNTWISLDENQSIEILLL